MFPLTPDQHHWLEVATEDEGWCSFTSCTTWSVPSRLFVWQRFHWRSAVKGRPTSAIRIDKGIRHVIIIIIIIILLLSVLLLLVVVDNVEVEQDIWKLLSSLTKQINAVLYYCNAQK